MGTQASYPIRHHHRLGATRSTALVAAATMLAAMLGNAVVAGWSRRRTISNRPDTPATEPAPGEAAEPKQSRAAGTAAAIAAAALAIIWLRRPAGRRRRPILFAVVDTETTGLDHTLDRVIELAVVHADGLGALTDTFTWRTRPEDGRHGAEHIHHISEADLATAPPFSAVADEVSNALRGRTLVAHNAPFDTRFLSREYRRAGRPIPAPLLRPLCTLELASRLSMAPLRLSEVARALGSPQPGTAHRAADDAVATAQLLAPLLNRAGIAQASELPLVDGSAPRSASLRSSRPAGRRSAI